MKVAVIGKGGREHALGWKLADSDQVDELLFLPGNAGTADVGENLPVTATDTDGVLAAARERRPDLVIIGPEAPLFAGLADILSDEGFRVLGPSRKAAMLEQEKAFAKEFMGRHRIPTASYKTFEDAAAAHHYIEGKDSPLVIKASGPAFGKGVRVCSATQEALAAVDEAMVERKFGSAGERVVIEERLEGEEASIVLLADGVNYVSFPPSQDHKPVGEGDTGPNTGGMGAYAPASLIDAKLLESIEEEIVEPTLRGLVDEGIGYRGVLYVGIMVTERGPKVLEYNCRFGDPETQPLMLITDEDLFELCYQTSRGNIKTRRVKTRPGSAVCVVAASKGYPGSYHKGKTITLGIDDEEVVCFHAGTKKEDGKLITSGGRVLGITAFADDLGEAKQKAYAPLEDGKVNFEGMYFRRDIGEKGIRRLAHEL